jgi:AraC-like DNA-binding protein/mannose-6-phosphate isomerase-like protein (cupin superfamily)
MRPKPLVLGVARQEQNQNISGIKMAFYKTEFSKDTYDFVDWHWHREFQFCLVDSGDVRFSIEDQYIDVKAGDGIFINSQRVHKAKPIHGDRATYYCIDFHPDLISTDQGSELFHVYVHSVIDSAEMNGFRLSSASESEGEILRRLHDMRNIYESGVPGFELELVADVLLSWHAMVALLPACSPLKNEAMSGNRFKDILLFIQNNYHEALKLDDIANHIHLSRSECSRYFKKMTGQTLFEYLVAYRIEKSLELLSGTDLTIAQVAIRVGFDSQSYYTACFKKIRYMTPKKYRQENRA